MQFDKISLEYKGHAGFLIITSDYKIYIDPYKLSAGSANYKADIILITHSHYDHCSIEDLRKIVKDGTVVILPPDCSSKLSKIKEKLDIGVVEPGQEIEIKGIKIKTVPAYNINKNFHSKTEYWNGYVIDIDGTKIYHAGDTDLIPEMSSIGEQGIDVALLPVGGTYTMNAEEAAKAAFMIKPKLAIPMHWGSLVGTNEDAMKFVDLCEGEGISAKVLEKK